MKGGLSSFWGVSILLDVLLIIFLHPVLLLSHLLAMLAMLASLLVPALLSDGGLYHYQSFSSTLMLLRSLSSLCAHCLR